MEWSKFLSVENIMFLAAAMGWLVAIIMILMRWIAPKTSTTKDDEFLAWLEWLKVNAPMVFAKVKLLHETKQLPEGVDRYAEYMVRLGDAFAKSFNTVDKVIPSALQPTARLIADGLHAADKLNPPPAPEQK